MKKKDRKRLKNLLEEIEYIIYKLEEERAFYFVHQFIPDFQNKVEQIDMSLIQIYEYRELLYNKLDEKLE